MESKPLLTFDILHYSPPFIPLPDFILQQYFLKYCIFSSVYAFDTSVSLHHFGVSLGLLFYSSLCVYVLSPCMSHSSVAVKKHPDQRQLKEDIFCLGLWFQRARDKHGSLSRNLRIWIFNCKQQSESSEWKVGWGHGITKTSSHGMLPPARLYHLNFPKQSQQLGTKRSDIWGDVEVTTLQPPYNTPWLPCSLWPYHNRKFMKLNF